MRVSTTTPLEDDERQLLLTNVRRRDDIGARTTWFIYSTGAHPWCLSNPKLSRFRVTEDQGMKHLNFRLAKPATRRDPDLHVPLNPEIQPWVQAFIESELGYSEREYYRRVTMFGESIGLEGLSPRTLRHDFCLRILTAVDWDVEAAKPLTGTTTEVLLGYARRRRQRQVAPQVQLRAFR
jgi:integrase